MTQKKQWQPGTVLLGMAMIGGLGVLLMSTGIGLIPGAAFLGYALLLPVIEGAEHAWNALERLADWVMNKEDE